jgi:hypothetical protein
MSSKLPLKDSASSKRVTRQPKRNEAIIGTSTDTNTPPKKKQQCTEKPDSMEMDEDENENTVSSETLNTKSTYEEQTTFNGSETPLIDLSSFDIATEKEPETVASLSPLEGVEASMHAPQNNDKGKKKADDDMNVEDNQQAEASNTSNPEENTFIKVTKATKFSATTPWVAVPGEQTWKKIDNINHYFEKNQDYAGAKQYNLRKTRERVISIYFTSESSLATAIEEPI